MGNILYGDGIRDDTDAIQDLLDSGKILIELPSPEKCYIISRMLKIHSYQQFKLPRFCHIKLAEGSDCIMLGNADTEKGNTNIEITGGIWDLNNLGQGKNPFLFPAQEKPDYNGFGLFFRNVKGFKISDLTLKDPVTFAVTLDTVRNFTVENIEFDFNYGNPMAVNMDGIHLNGNCSFGSIHNLKGSCYDDLVALNADEGSAGPITDISIDGIFADDCHSAVRLLSVKHKVENIDIRNIYGSYYQYCVGVTKFYEGEAAGGYDAITLDGIYASKAERLSVYCKDGSYVYPLIWIEKDLHVKNININKVYRKERTTEVSTVYIGSNTKIDSISITNTVCEDFIGKSMPLIENHGYIKYMHTDNLSAGNGPALLNEGEIDCADGAIEI